MNPQGTYRPVSLGEEPLVESPPASATATAVPMMSIVAPANLPEDYVLDVQHNGATIQVNIPPGGVEAGQVFQVPMPNGTANGTTNNNATDSSIPVGHWKDDICACFRYGLCHAHCWTSWLCTAVATAQVIRRLGLDWQGRPTDNASAKAQAFPIIFGVTAVYFVVTWSLALYAAAHDVNADYDSQDPAHNVQLPEPKSYTIPMGWYRFIHYIYWVAATVLLLRVRMLVRQRFAIPGQPAEDLVCSVCCHCCTAAQMLRHTADYDTKPAYLLSDDGLRGTSENVMLL